MQKNKAILLLQDNTVFNGYQFGANQERIGELTCVTDMTGVTELLSDPASAGKMICMIYPEIGVDGVNPEDMESGKIHAEAIAVKSYARTYSNWRAKLSLEEWITKNQTPGIYGIDTRALFAHIRKNGPMTAIISSTEFNTEILAQKIKNYNSSQHKNLHDSTARKTANEIKSESPTKRIAILDLGAPNSFISEIAKKQAEIKLFPIHSTINDWKAWNADCLIISSGTEYLNTELISLIQNVLDKIPIVGIETGAILLAKACGANIEKMNMAHYGSNHPITYKNKHILCKQRHSLGIKEPLPSNLTTISTNAIDKSIEVFAHTELPVFGFLPRVSVDLWWDGLGTNKPW